MSKEKSILSLLARKKTSLFALLIIGIACFIAIFANLLAPDKSINANDQIPELALVDANQTFKILRFRKNKIIEKTSFFKTAFKGKENPFQTIPYNNYNIEGDSLIIEKYEGVSEFGIQREGSMAQFHLMDIAFPIREILQNREEYKAIAVDGSTLTISRSRLLKQIENEQLIEKCFYFGTDKFGRSIISRLFLGIRISLLVGLIAVLISLSIGILVGALGGYFGGTVDNFVMLLINTVWSIPTLLLVFAIVLALGRGIGIIFFAVGLTMWVEVARIVRGQVKYFKESQFIEAAKSLAFSKSRIIIKHILPNIIGPVLVIASANFATAILIEAGLSYLGFGIRPPAPSIGNMLNENYGFALNGKPMLALIPALTIMLLVLAFNVLGNALRDVFDVKAD